MTEASADTYRFASAKTTLLLKLFDAPHGLHFTAKDRVLFYAGECDFIIADSKTGLPCRSFRWAQIENLVAGEPESENSLLFQG